MTRCLCFQLITALILSEPLTGQFYYRRLSCCASSYYKWSSKTTTIQRSLVVTKQKTHGFKVGCSSDMRCYDSSNIWSAWLHQLVCSMATLFLSLTCPYSTQLKLQPNYVGELSFWIQMSSFKLVQLCASSLWVKNIHCKKYIIHLTLILQSSVGICSKNQHATFDWSAMGPAQYVSLKLVCHKTKLQHYLQWAPVLSANRRPSSI